MKSGSGKRLVYSTDQGRLCPDCQQPVTRCRCQKAKAKSREQAEPARRLDGSLRLHRQVKGRGGKTVTLIEGLDLTTPATQLLIKEIKTRCGVGGKIEGSLVLIQGDKRSELLTLLGEKGYKVKLAGG